MKKPHGFMATEKSFTVHLDKPCLVSGYTQGDKSASFYRPFPVKKGDVFKVAPGGLTVNGVFHAVRARKLKVMQWKVSWVAKRLRVAVFKDQDRIWNRRTKKPTNRFGKPYWTACDIRSYHIGCAETAEQAIKNLIWQCQATNLCAQEEEAKGHTVIRWRCLLPKNEAREMEIKAKKTGFILDGVEVPPLPAHWQRGLDRLKRKAKAT
jgi:hypothetical protein